MVVRRCTYQSMERYQPGLMPACLLEGHQRQARLPAGASGLMWCSGQQSSVLCSCCQLRHCHDALPGHVLRSNAASKGLHGSGLDKSYLNTYEGSGSVR